MVADQALRPLDRVTETARRRPVTLHQDLRPVLVEGDPLFLERCLFNLLENAIKYNVRERRGPAHPEEGARGRTGPLVPPYAVEDLFVPSSRMQGDRVRSSKGAGLGLSIVRPSWSRTAAG